MQDLDISVLMVNETWERENLQEKRIIETALHEHGINFIGRKRPGHKTGGGVGLLFKEDEFQIEQVSISSPTNFEFQVCYLRPKTPKAFNILLFIPFYLSPNIQTNQLDSGLNILHEIVQQAMRKFPGLPIFIAGDSNRVPIESILAIDDSLQTINSNPTRGLRCLDHLLTNKAKYYHYGKVLPPIYQGQHASDHKMLFLEKRKVGHKSDQSFPIMIRKFPESSMRDFGMELSLYNWRSFRNLPCNDIAEDLQTILTTLVDKHFPQQKKIIKRTSRPFYTERLEKIRKCKQYEFKRHGKSTTYFKLNTQYKQELLAAKRNYRDRNIKSVLVAADAKRMYKALKLLSGIHTEPSTFVLPGHEKLSPKMVSNILAQYFSNISQEYPKLQICDLPERVRYCLDKVEKSSIPQFNSAQILQKMEKMKKPNSTVEGDLPLKVLKEFLLELSVPLSRLVNACLIEGEFPHCYKMETCVVIPKISPPQSLDQLRNLGLTQFCSKVIEAMVIDLLTPWLKDDEAQFGGKKNTSTCHYLIELIEFILEAQEEQDMSVAMLCADFSKGFNRIHPVRLITTFFDMGVPGYLLKILISYMSNRRMRVRYNGVLSDEQSLPGGSPQGGLLSIVIFCIYTSGCGMSMEGGTWRATPEHFPKMPLNQPMREKEKIRLKYVDDTSLAAKLALSQLLKVKEETLIPPYLFENLTARQTTGYEMTSNRNTLHDMIEDLEGFVHQNYMKVNEGKSKLMHFNNKRKDGSLDYQLNGKPIEQVETMKILGFQFQSNLGISKHINMILTKATKKLWALRQLMNGGGTINDGKKFYLTWILPLLEGQAPVWHGRLTSNQRESLEKIQKRSLKIILKKGYVNYASAMQGLDLKTLHERREHLCFKFTKKAAKYHPSLYPKKIAARETRLGNKDQLQVPKFRSELHKKSGKVFLTRLYNRKYDFPVRQTVETPPPRVRRRGRCGKCMKCLTANCGKCDHCLDMPSYGGNGKLKQACRERKCVG